MRKKARVIVTLDCPRNCVNCCNKEEVFEQHKVLQNIDDLLGYDEIMITGGEPMLIPWKVTKFVQDLRDKGYVDQIYMYSALYNSPWDYKQLLNALDGIQFTLHYEATYDDIYQLNALSKLLTSATVRDMGHRSNRLCIDKRLYDKYDFSNIDFSGWSVVKKLVWLDNCPLPPGEELFIHLL